MATEYNPNYCLHPGEFLKDDLKMLKMSQKTLAKTSGFSTTVINEVIKGKRKVNADMAIKFEEIIGEPASFWMDAQRNYDLFVAKHKSKPKKRNDKDRYNYRMIKSDDSWTSGNYAASVLVGVDDMQNIESSYNSEFRLVSLVQTESRFHREPGFVIKNLAFDFTPKYSVNGTEADVELVGTVSDGEQFVVSSTFIAKFECKFSSEITDEVKTILIEQNTLSIMFPFLRSQIAMLTCVPNMEPIVLPTININAYIQNRRGKK